MNLAKNSVIAAYTLNFEMLMAWEVQQQGNLVSIFRSKDKVSTEMLSGCHL